MSEELADVLPNTAQANFDGSIAGLKQMEEQLRGDREEMQRVIDERIAGIEESINERMAPLQQQIRQLQKEVAPDTCSSSSVTGAFNNRAPGTCSSSSVTGALNNLAARLRIAQREKEQFDFIGADAALVGLAHALGTSSTRQGSRTQRRPQLTLVKRDAAQAFVTTHSGFELRDNYVHHGPSGRKWPAWRLDLTSNFVRSRKYKFQFANTAKTDALNVPRVSMAQLLLPPPDLERRLLAIGKAITVQYNLSRLLGKECYTLAIASKAASKCLDVSARSTIDFVRRLANRSRHEDLLDVCVPKTPVATIIIPAPVTPPCSLVPTRRQFDEDVVKGTTDFAQGAPAFTAADTNEQTIDCFMEDHKAEQLLGMSINEFVGDFVRFTNLISQPDLNGCLGETLDYCEKKRFSVRVLGRVSAISVKPANLAIRRDGKSLNPKFHQCPLCLCGDQHDIEGVCCYCRAPPAPRIAALRSKAPDCDYFKFPDHIHV